LRENKKKIVKFLFSKSFYVQELCEYEFTWICLYKYVIFSGKCVCYTTFAQAAASRDKKIFLTVVYISHRAILNSEHRKISKYSIETAVCA
jgi:hypothetical protein